MRGSLGSVRATGVRAAVLTRDGKDKASLEGTTGNR